MAESVDSAMLGVEPLDAALPLVVIAADGHILYLSAAAQVLFGEESEQLLGQHWQSTLVVDKTSRALLGLLLEGNAVALPPVVFNEACVCEGSIQSISFAGEAARLLVLRPVPVTQQLAALPALEDADAIAVVAVDQLRYGSDWTLAETESLLNAIREQLHFIVGERDGVGGVFGNAVTLALQGVDEDGAANICRASLSHLYSSIARLEGLRLTVGIARASGAQQWWAALLNAQRSVLLAQRESLREPIRIAQHDDHELILGTLVHSAADVMAASPQATSASSPQAESGAVMIDSSPPITPIETGIEGYVADNMEGAVDQAMFMAQLDVPVSIVGPAGTGKMYIAKIIHEQRRVSPDLLVPVDCREFRSRASAMRRISSELRSGLGRTLVFKSPHLMHPEVQQKLARNIATRTLTDVSPARYLPDIKFVALFPEPLEVLVQRGELLAALASVFAGFPIRVPPIRDRKQAVLRWAHKILGQEGALRDRVMKGFTPDAERAMLAYVWPGNISEMRVCIHNALDKTDKDWLTPVDLGLYEGIDPEGVPEEPVQDAFLSLVDEPGAPQPAYESSTMERLDQALGEAIHDMLALELVKPLGAWLEDEMVLAVLERYRDGVPKSASFLHTSARNIRRWLPKIESRENERTTSNLWQKPSRILRDWVREAPPPSSSPIALMQDKLMVHLVEQAAGLSSAKRAQVMGVSTPTYLKRLRALEVGS